MDRRSAGSHLFCSGWSCLFAHPVPSLGTIITLGSFPLFSDFRLGRWAGGGMRRAAATFPRLCKPCRATTAQRETSWASSHAEIAILSKSSPKPDAGCYQTRSKLWRLKVKPWYDVHRWAKFELVWETFILWFWAQYMERTKDKSTGLEHEGE